MSHVIIGTAGHVDHGKTALIKALTGRNTDRLREEQERGISIDLGFAPFRLPGGRQAGVVDVPGHERFIHNMLAGIGGIDLVLLVVDVMEGVMPQTREHVEIMNLLQIPRGIVVLTKIDMVEDKEWLDLVEEEVREALQGTFLSAGPFHRVSALTEEGLKELLFAIDDMTAKIPSRDTEAPLRLPVDRVFSITGFGTIVTGTLLTGRIKVGMSVEIVPNGKKARVRQVQVHGEAVNEAFAGQRVAINLPGIEQGDLSRGSVLATPGTLSSSFMFDARMHLLNSSPRSLRNLTRVHVHLGAGRSVGRMALLDCEELPPGGTALVQVRLEKEMVVRQGDGYIIRSFSPVTTIGGGQVLAAGSGVKKHKRHKQEVVQLLQELEKGDPSVGLLQEIRRELAVTSEILGKSAGLPDHDLQDALTRLQEEKKIVKKGDYWLDAAVVTGWQEKLLSELEAFHRARPLLAGMSRSMLKGLLPPALPSKVYDSLLAGLAAQDKILVQGEQVLLAGHEPRLGAKEEALLAQLQGIYLEGGFTPPGQDEVARLLNIKKEMLDDLLDYMGRRGEVVRLDEHLLLHSKHFNLAREALHDHFSIHDTLAVKEFRDKIGASRKYILPLLELFDKMGLTRREGEERVPWRMELPSRKGGGRDEGK